MNCSVTALSTGGNSVVLSNVLSLTLSEMCDTPAKSFLGDFLVDGDIPPLTSVRVILDSASFSGNIDEQILSISESGTVLRLTARSMGALLVDNESRPQVYFGVRLSQILSRHLEPYGFRCAESENRYLSTFTIRKGMSEWDVLQNFCAYTFGAAPAVRDHVLYPSGLPVDTTHQLDSYLSLSLRRKPYEAISDVYLRDSAGYYSAKVTNSLLSKSAPVRRRYLIPGDEFTGQASLDARKLIDSSMEKYETASLTLPGVTPAELGDVIALSSKLFVGKTMRVAKRQLDLSRDGITSTLTLKNTHYSKGGI